MDKKITLESEKNPSQRRRPARSCITCLGLLILAVVLGWVGLNAIGGILIVSDRVDAVDAIAVLSGGTDQARFKYAAKLFNDGKADWVIITDTGLELPDGSFMVKDYIISRLGSYGVPSEKVLIASGDVTSTRQEAAAIRALAEEYGIGSIMVVTDPYHTLRTKLIFWRAFRGSGTSVYARAVEDSWYRADTWWRTSLGRNVTWNEYIKLIGFLFGA